MSAAGSGGGSQRPRHGRVYVFIAAISLLTIGITTAAWNIVPLERGYASVSEGRSGAFATLRRSRSTSPRAGTGIV